MSKKIMIIDGGPRKNFNMGQLYESFTAGVKSVSDSIEVERVRLYDLDFKGCISCMGCKLAGGKNVGKCLKKDGLSPIIEAMKTADGLAFGSPVYFMYITGMLEMALERMVFPWLNYKNGQCMNENRVPTATFYTMNATPEQAAQFNMEATVFGRMDMVIGMCWSQPERVCAYNTVQVKDYSRYDFHPTMDQIKQEWHAAHWQEDLATARQAGVNMAKKIRTTQS